ncbi:MAG: helix-turn-helix transcriptional regulator [Cyanobacteria bacterium J06592_8]
MIKNDKQYQYTQELARQFAEAIQALEQDRELQKNDPEGWQMSLDVKQCHWQQLQAEISEYERLINCERKQPIQIAVESIDKWPDVLIKARIAAHLTQQELAEILGIEVHRVKEYEETDYQCASFLELLEVSTVFGLKLDKAVVKVNFEEVEVARKCAEKWHQARRKKATQNL